MRHTAPKTQSDAICVAIGELRRARGLFVEAVRASDPERTKSLMAQVVAIEDRTIYELLEFKGKANEGTDGAGSCPSTPCVVCDRVSKMRGTPIGKHLPPQCCAARTANQSVEEETWTA